jgi:hypothetical protein
MHRDFAAQLTHRNKGAAMNTNQGQGTASTLHGSLLRLSTRREIAIDLRDGTAWVAEFGPGHAEVSIAGGWFALNHDRWALRRATLEAITPLPADVVQRIEDLHRRMSKPSVAAALPRALVTLVRRLRGMLARQCRPLFGLQTAHPLESET